MCRYQRKHLSTFWEVIGYIGLGTEKKKKMNAPQAQGKILTTK